MASINATSNSTSTISGLVDVQNKDVFTVSGAIVGTTESSITIPLGVKSWRIQAASSAGAAVLTLSHESGGTSVATTSFDICPGTYYKEDFLKGDGVLTLYIKSSKSGTPVQILTWT